MRGGSRLYWFAGVASLGLLLALAGCGRGIKWGGEREAWRTEAEAECMKSGAVKTDADVVRIAPIGDGFCGAEYPLKVAALGVGGTAMSYADAPRPPGSIPNGNMPPWPSQYAPPPPAPSSQSEPRLQWTPGPPPARQSSEPISLAPGSLDDIAVGRGGSQAPAPAHQPRPSAPPAYEPRVSAPPTYAPPPPQYRPQQSYEPSPTYRAPQAQPLSGARSRYQQPQYEPPQAEQPEDEPDDIPDDAILPDRHGAAPRSTAPRSTYSPPPQQQRDTYAPAARPLSGRYEPPRESPREPPRLGPQRAYTPVKAAVTPPATLACPIVSALDKWVNEGVQPAAMRWFGQPVVEIKQISSYACRGMVGGSGVSEHAFGNALDVAGFVLADGRKVVVKDGWNGRPEESGFLHDVQGSACQIFTTVLAPGYNIYHYNHIHLDLMRRASGRTPCRPDAISGEVAYARQLQKSKYAGHHDRLITGSISKDVKNLPRAIPGEDGEFDEPGVSKAN